MNIENNITINACTFSYSTAQQYGGKLLTFDIFLGVMYISGSLNNLTINDSIFSDSTS